MKTTYFIEYWYDFGHKCEAYKENLPELFDFIERMRIDGYTHFNIETIEEAF